jgi:ABC-2 type transport system permease protein
MKQIWAIARKELEAYFASPLASIFTGTFLCLSLFVFFWMETFFARNIADIRPLFRWLPILLIFLVAALTMRLWSEEQKMGTIEILLTLPVRICHIVAGKFLAALALVVIALILTSGLPITVSFMGDLDWGPVFAGYLGAGLMAAAYVAIGLFISSKTDNQIIALISTVLVCGAFYLIGSNQITDFFGNQPGEILRAIGTGSRFESIERGVIDLRDLIYYLSLTLFFLILNIFSLDKKRWSNGANTARYRKNAWLAVILAGLNLVALNVWLSPFHSARADLTSQREYSISQVTRDLVTSLDEPLLIRGYFSAKTHPLLATLIPRIKDTITEYSILSGGKVIAEFVDPREDEEIEAEANRAYGIKPVPFQIAGRYEASVINSYFDILIKYGDQYETLGFGDIIEVQARKDGTLDVQLRNLEYDLTRSIKKAVYGFQNVESIFEETDNKILLTAFITRESLPDALSELPERITRVAEELQELSKGKLEFTMIDPDIKESPVTRKELQERYGLQPLAFSIFSGETFYLHLVLQVGEEINRIYPAGDMTEADIRTEIEAALKRSVSGFLKTVGLWTPSEKPSPDLYGRMQPPISSYQFLKTKLKENYTVKLVDLVSGRIPGDVDTLLIIAPQGMTDKERFAADQYLMRGGALIVAAGNYALDRAGHGSGLSLRRIDGGLKEMLASYGVDVCENLVLDTQNEPFPVPVTRDLGGFQIQEIHQVDYPYFVDVRKDGMDKESPILSGIAAVTMHWVSPIETDQVKNQDRNLTVLLTSTENAWLNDATDIQPDFERYPEIGFPVEGERKSRILAVTLKGRFESCFKDKPSPFSGEEPTGKEPEKKEKEPEEEGDREPAMQTISSSPNSARLVVIGSGEFVNDTIINISRMSGQNRFLNGLDLLENLIDWSVEDEDLLAIRSRGYHAKILKPMIKAEQTFWETTNYVIVILSLAVIAVFSVWTRKRQKPMMLSGLPDNTHAQ